MSRMLLFYSGKCAGCHYCEIACSFRHKEVCGRSDSLIRIRHDEKNLTGSAFFCHHCGKPVCIELCPVKAIKKDGESGRVTIDAKVCIGCGLCLECPLGGIAMDRVTGLAVNCDLCGGTPACVEFCPQKALQYITPAEARLVHTAPVKTDKGGKK